MATKPVVKRSAVAAKAAPVKTDGPASEADTKQHRIPGVTAKNAPTAVKTPTAVKASPKSALNSLLGDLSKKTTAQPKKKNEKPVITLNDRAADLLEYQKAVSTIKTLEGKVAQLSEELLPEIEAHRMGICAGRHEYLGSIHVQATGNDDDGVPIEAGQAVYYVQNRYSGFDPFAPTTDDEIKATFGDEATVKNEAVAAIVANLAAQGMKVSYEEAEKMLDDRMETKANISLAEGALQDPKVIEILREHLAQHLVSKTSVTPTDAFHERASYDITERTIMEALNNIGLCRRAKAVLKPSGAPK